MVACNFLAVGKQWGRQRSIGPIRPTNLHCTGAPCFKRDVTVCFLFKVCEGKRSSHVYSTMAKLSCVASGGSPTPDQKHGSTPDYSGPRHAPACLHGRDFRGQKYPQTFLRGATCRCRASQTYARSDLVPASLFSDELCASLC